MLRQVFIDPRAYDKRIRIERLTTTKDSEGGAARAWTLVEMRWCKITTKAANKPDATRAAGGEVSAGSHEIELRYFEGLAPTTHRLVHRGTVYEVLGVVDYAEQRVKHIATCRSGVSDG